MDFPSDCTTDDQKAAYLYRISEVLRLEHNKAKTDADRDKLLAKQRKVLRDVDQYKSFQTTAEEFTPEHDKDLADFDKFKTDSRAETKWDLHIDLESI